MIKQLLYLFILSFELSCATGEQESKYILIADKSGTTLLSKNIKGIRFDFSARRVNTFKETIEIKATLYNDKTDTLYFLTSTCEGEQYSLRYDTAIFTLTPRIFCNVSLPKLANIPPKGQYNFQAHFRCSSNETRIKLGFDFYQVEKTFDVINKNFGDINIFNRSVNDQTIIWADEMEIK